MHVSEKILHAASGSQTGDAQRKAKNNCVKKNAKRQFKRDQNFLHGKLEGISVTIAD